jgi:hypothetical protein
MLTKKQHDDTHLYAVSSNTAKDIGFSAVSMTSKSRYFTGA